jgi:hypothetical protein
MIAQSDREAMHARARRLLEHWEALRQGERLPPIDALRIDDLPELAPEMWAAAVLNGGDDYHVTHAGAALNAWGAFAPPGTRLSERFPKRTFELMTGWLRLIVLYGRPHWEKAAVTVSPIRIGARVERLAVPFARDGRNVDHVAGISIVADDLATPPANDERGEIQGGRPAAP